MIRKTRQERKKKKRKKKIIEEGILIENIAREVEGH